MLKNGQTYLKTWRCSHCKIFQTCLDIFQDYILIKKKTAEAQLICSSREIVYPIWFANFHSMNKHAYLNKIIFSKNYYW